MKKILRIAAGTIMMLGITFISVNDSNAQVITQEGDCDAKLAKCLRNPGWTCILLDENPENDCSTPDGWSWTL
jgi:hypothetical protein